MNRKGGRKSRKYKLFHETNLKPQGPRKRGLVKERRRLLWGWMSLSAQNLACDNVQTLSSFWSFAKGKGWNTWSGSNF